MSSAAVTFVADISLYAFVNNHGIAVPLMRLVKITALMVLCAFALHLRLVWCRIQPLLALALLLCALVVRTDRRPSSSYTFDGSSTRLSHYECIRYAELVPRWHLLLVVYAAWIAYGALFHEGRHVADDLAVLDGLLLPGDIGSAFIVSAVRLLTLLLLSCASMSPWSFARFTSRHASFGVASLCAVYAALLALPPINGVPQVLSVGETVGRCFFLILMFAASEAWRAVAEHSAFVTRACSGALSASEVRDLQQRVREVAVRGAAKYSSIPPPTKNIEEGDGDDPVFIEDAVGVEEFPVTLSTLSAMRSAWILTTPNNYIAFCSAFVFLLCAIHYTSQWSLLTRARAEKCFTLLETTNSVAEPMPASAKLNTSAAKHAAEEIRKNAAAKPKQPPPPAPSPSNTIVNRRTSPSRVPAALSLITDGTEDYDDAVSDEEVRRYVAALASKRAASTAIAAK
jgi:hypothetical protein